MPRTNCLGLSESPGSCIQGRYSMIAVPQYSTSAVLCNIQVLWKHFEKGGGYSILKSVEVGDLIPCLSSCHVKILVQIGPRTNLLFEIHATVPHHQIPATRALPYHHEIPATMDGLPVFYSIINTFSRPVYFYKNG